MPARWTLDNYSHQLDGTNRKRPMPSRGQSQAVCEDDVKIN